MKTIKTIAMAIAMTIIGTATTYAKTTVINHNHKPTAVVAVHNHHGHHNMHARDHRHMNKPVHNCLCKHCKKMRHAIEKEMRRREAEMRRIEAHRHHHHPEVNARTGNMAYIGRR